MTLTLTAPERIADRHSVRLTQVELLDGLTAQHGAFVVTIETRTIPAMAKTGNPWAGNCVKLSRVNGILNWQYASAVNRQRDREGLIADFEAYPRKWGQRIAGTPLVQHKGRTYVELKVERSLGYQYETLDGQPIDPADLAPFLRAPSETRQGVEREIILRDYALDSITALTYGGQRYEVESETEQPAELRLAA